MATLLHLTKNEETALLKLKSELHKNFDILDMRLFGSKARGDSNEESDIDLMIELADRDFFLERKIFDVIYDINLEFDVFIIPLFMGRRLITEGPMSESPIYKIIQKEGVSL